MEHPVVFEYQDPRAFLKDVLGFKRFRNRNFSARSWARMMGFRSHALLGFLLAGKRRIRPQHLENLLKGLDLDERERRYFQTLVHYRIATNDTEKKLYQDWLAEAARDPESKVLEIDHFKVVADWVHWAIAEMTLLKDFRPDPEWISKRLGGARTPEVIGESIERLVSVGLLKRTENGLKKVHSRVTTPKNAVSRAIREHHRAVLGLAGEALDSQSTHERFFNSCTMTIDRRKLPEAQNLILEFRSKMERLMVGADETYELSVQFFRLTRAEDGGG